MLRYLSATLVFVLFFISNEKNLFTKNNTVEKMISCAIKSPEALMVNDSSGCDADIRKHVYNPARLKVIENCITVLGVITESHAEEDGDQHLLLKPDTGHENLLNKKNIKSKKGNLVIEIICMNNITDSKVGDACKGYVNQIKLPAVGSHVRVTGTYVIDTHNGWAEIHPISKIELQ